MSANVLLKAKIRMPMMPNFVSVDSVRPASLDEAHAYPDGFKIDVGQMDDEAIQEFCKAWAIAFTEHAKARRPR